MNCKHRWEEVSDKPLYKCDRCGAFTPPPAKQELDPLAGDARDDWNDWRDDQGVYSTALNPPARQEPAWWPAVENILNEYGLQAIDFVADFKAAKHPWVGLTLEIKMDMAESYFTDEWAINRAIQLLSGCEAALKEKNNG